MEETERHSLKIEAIQRDLNRIEDEWLRLHNRLAVVFIAIAFTLESVMAFFIANSDILSTTIFRYILKFIVAPSGLAGVGLLMCTMAIHSDRLSRKAKIYAVSLLFVFISFVYYSAHSAFIATASLYIFAIFLTTTYADYRLTVIVSASSLCTLIVSELFLFWDLDKVSVFSSAARMFDFLIIASVIAGCCIVASVSIYYERRKNQAALRREVERSLLKESLQHDELTGVYNRKALHEALRLLELKDPGEPLVFCIADIDHFKMVNDRFGHQIGDMVLSEFACLLNESFGESSVYRYGGDEFCLILRNMTSGEAIRQCESVLAKFHRVKYEDAPGLKPGASFGLTVYSANGGTGVLFDQADDALYEAKKTRNAIRVYGEWLPKSPARKVAGGVDDFDSPVKLR